MKKITLLFVALMALGFTGLQAQSCAKKAAACASKTSVAAKSCHGANAAAVQLASLDESIETQTCKESGKVSFVRKEACPVTGKVTFTSVNYDAELGKFVNVSPSEAKACCDKDKATGCCSGAAKGASASAVKTSMTNGKSAAKCSTAMKACCAKKNSSKVAEVDEAKVKPVKVQKGS
ncbi:MAG: hypothetical protein R3330_01380 [Saprospiraceae bacterium]|nr:hypothetical protein [Saprospiraceae bacterium]